MTREEKEIEVATELEKQVLNAINSGRYMIAITYAVDKKNGGGADLKHHLLRKNFPADVLYKTHVEIEKLVKAAIVQGE